MAKYIVLERFADLQDNKYTYDAGDVFPRVGLVVSDDRLKTLLSDENGANRPLIKEIVDDTPKTRQIDAERVPEVSEIEDVKLPEKKSEPKTSKSKTKSTSRSSSTKKPTTRRKATKKDAD